MLTPEQKKAIISRELDLQTSRSSGKGGQHVNKVESKVELSFDVAGSAVLTGQQKSVLLSRQSVLTDGRYIRVQESRDRSQHVNREKATEKLFALIDKALQPKKKRVATRPSRSSKEKKLKEKKQRGELKKTRRDVF